MAELALLAKFAVGLKGFHGLELLSHGEGFKMFKGLVIANAAIDVHERVISLRALSLRCLALRLTRRSILHASL